MALVYAWRGSIHSNVDATSYQTSATFTPAANELLIAFVGTQLNTGPADASTVTGHGVSYAKAATILSDSGLRRIGVWVADAGASPTSVAVQANFGATQQGGDVQEYSAAGAAMGGGALAAIVQAVTDSATGTSGSLTLAAASYAENRPIACFQIAVDEAMAGHSGSWSAEQGGHGSPNARQLAQYRNDAYETPVTASWTSSVEWLGVALEIKEAGAPSGTKPWLFLPHTRTLGAGFSRGAL